MDDSSNDSSLDLDLSVVGGSSTPMNSSFLSPLKKLDNLNLNNLSDITEDDFEAANKTIETSSDIETQHEGENNSQCLPLDQGSPVSEGGSRNGSRNGSRSDSEDEAQLLSQRPLYVNKRKRINTSDIEMITPVSRSISNSNERDQINNMSICSNVTSTSLSNLKLSFSNSDSTPCPVPAKKKIRYDQNTPITKKKLLNFSHSVKTKIDDLIFNDKNPHIYDNEDNEYNEYNESDDNNEGNEHYRDDNDLNTKLEMNYYHSTPISQSTPSNSRIPSPTSSRKSTPIKSTPIKSTPIKTDHTLSLHNISIDDSYQTPIFESRKTIRGYTLINKEVDPDLDEADQRFENNNDSEDDESSFVGNTRINDPYLTEPKFESHLRTEFFNKDLSKLPLLQDYYNLEKHEILKLITPTNIYNFYEAIILDEPMIELLKNERVRWHPDKRSFVNSSIDLDLVNAISQCLNSIIDNL